MNTSHIVKATELKLFAKFHDDWSKQSVSNATSPNYADYEVTHAWARNFVRQVFNFLSRNIEQNLWLFAKVLILINKYGKSTVTQFKLYWLEDFVKIKSKSIVF